jgi:phytol kinase
MLKYFYALFPVLIVLFISEFLWRKKLLRGEFARKFVHILSGIHIAFWPFYIAFNSIVLIGVVTFVAMLYSKYTKLFHAIYDVSRITVGELLYPLSISLVAFLARQSWVFTVSLLFMVLADGMAAVVGRIMGKNNSYKVFGSKHLQKSVIGTFSYLMFAVYAMLLGMFIGGEYVINQNIILCVVVMPLAGALLENISPFGLDNITTPLLVTLVMNSLL